MRRRQLLIAVALILVWSVAISAQGDLEPSASIPTGEELRYVSLEEAESIALANSHAVQLADLSVQEAELQLEQVQAAQLMQPSPVMMMQVQAGYDLARHAYVMAQDDLSLTVKTDFYTVLQVQNMLEIAREGLESARRHLSVTEQKFQVGTVTRLDVIQASRNVLNSEAGVLQAQHGLELAVMKFRQTMGLGLDSQVWPEEEAFEPVAMAVDIEDDLAFALENRQEIQQLRIAVNSARKSVELADNDYTPALELRTAQLQLQQAEVQLEQVKQLLTLEMRQSYTAMEEARQRVPVLEKGVEEAEEMLRLSELMFEADMITANDMQDAQLGLLAARNDLVTAISDYNIAQARYRYTVARALRDQ